ncbi:MAG: hydrogenase 3 maturation endopeptidase HyCI [Acidobacteriota bacterium]|nr:hydrogenase 3 maturation endopeptidase HyCI [Acidobacteriota bacterium]
MLMEELKARIKGKTMLVGIGNAMRGDDAAGPRLIAALEGKVEAALLDAGEMPEAYLGRICQAAPETIVLLDAANLGAAPGAVAILDSAELGSLGLSTHQMPLELLARYLREQTGANVFALGVQPRQLDFFAAVSPEVEETISLVTKILIAILHSKTAPETAAVLQGNS